MEEKSSDTIGVPAEAKKFIECVARKCSWRRSIRKEVRRELSAHFEDALCDVDEAEKNGVAQGLIKDFGDPVLLAALIGRGKRRCLPWWERTLLATVKIAAVLLVVGVVVDLVLSRHSSEALQAEIARLHSTGAPTSVHDIIEKAQQDPRTKALSKEERLKRCPATALLYEISDMHPELATDVHGKRVYDLGDTDTFVKQLYETWDADTAAAVSETLSRNRDLLEKIQALAALPPDGQNDIIWFQSQYWPEKRRELGVSMREASPTMGADMLTAPYLLGLLDTCALLELDAVHAVQEGGADAALDDATATMTLSHHTDMVSHTLIGTMVAVALRSRALAITVQPLLNRADVSDTAANRFLAVAAQMDCSEAFAKSLAWERMFMVSALKSGELENYLLSRQSDPSSLLGKLHGTPFDPYILRARLLPFLNNNDLATWIGYLNRLVDAANLRYPEYCAAGAVWKNDLLNTSSWIAPITKIGMPNLVDIKDDITDCEVLEDLARVAFALRRFKLVRGAYPDALQALVPDFLSEVPMDRFSEKPLLYRKAGEGCVVYSVGKEQDNEGGEGDYDYCTWKLTR
jgi:hypothetical protein